MYTLESLRSSHDNHSTGFMGSYHQVKIKLTICCLDQRTGPQMCYASYGMQRDTCLFLFLGAPGQTQMTRMLDDGVVLPHFFLFWTMAGATLTTPRLNRTSSLLNRGATLKHK
eukprot:4231754-Amphidinium_carterae.1